jgi:tRNA threonylcarbamoyl adenosine modification protein (Sua5/YciO/YrdC/YwlC family)
VAQLFAIHPQNPQLRLVRQAAEMVRAGSVIVYPTDSCYALGCKVGDKGAIERMRSIRETDASHPLTLMCRDLAQVARYSRVDNRRFRLIKATTPGSYTFILEATREVPKRLLSRRNTIGLRIPEHAVAQALLSELGEPMLSTTLILPQDELPLNDPAEIRDRLGNRVDLILDSGPCGFEMTTIIDLTGEAPTLLRQGKGDIAPFGVGG